MDADVRRSTLRARHVDAASWNAEPAAADSDDSSSGGEEDAPGGGRNGKGGAYEDFGESPISHSSSYKPKHNFDILSGGKAAARAAPRRADPGNLAAYARYVPWVLLAVSALTRFYRLDEPRGNVFGEEKRRAPYAASQLNRRAVILDAW